MRTPLYDSHRSLGARLVSFAGWEMPLQYAGIIEEHRAVRACAGLFDVSHMGEIELRGPAALAVCREAAVNDAARLADGQIQYSLLCLPSGGTVDDVTLHRLSAERFLFCVNAANVEKDVTWLRAQARGRCEVIDRSPEYAQLALQGPRATGILAACATVPLETVRPFCFVEAEVAGVPALAARTGYTGEDGWELYCAAEAGPRLWAALMQVGAPAGLVPAGLGARDTLRLERALPLYGNELDEETTPLEAGLGWVVRMNHEFVGREALRRQREAGITRRLVGIAMRGPGIPRHGYALRRDGMRVGAVTSGTMSPTLGKAIGLGYVTSDYANIGEGLEVEVRRHQVPAEVVAIPFYRRQ